MTPKTGVTNSTLCSINTRLAGRVNREIRGRLVAPVDTQTGVFPRKHPSGKRACIGLIGPRSAGGVGDCFDNAVIESFWGRLQAELLNRQRWRTHVELAN